MNDLTITEFHYYHIEWLVFNFEEEAAAPALADNEENWKKKTKK